MKIMKYIGKKQFFERRKKRMKYNAKDYLLRNVESRLHRKWKALAARQGITMRKLLLNLLEREILEAETETV